MCRRCGMTDLHGKLLEANIELECSWCDQLYEVCSHGASQIQDGAMANLCGEHHAEMMEKRIGDFGRTAANRSDEERDVDANGWLSNAIRLLEDPEDR